MDSYNEIVSSLNTAIPLTDSTSASVVDSNYSWSTSTANLTPQNAISTDTATSTLSSQTSNTLESGININAQIQHLEEKAISEYMILMTALGLAAYFVFKNK